MSLKQIGLTSWARLTLCFVILSALFALVPNVSALALNATWTSETTIGDDSSGTVFTGPNGTDPITFSAGGEGGCSDRIEFSAGANLDASPTPPARFVERTLMRSTGVCMEQSSESVTFSNSRSQAGGGEEEGPAEPAASTCNVDGIGWIVCPVANFLAEITDAAYAIIEQLMVFRAAEDPFDTSTDNPLYTIWNNVRNVANIVFVIAFFMVIFSQATSIGIGAYGIKKMLPRIIVAAILVNLSYYICLFAIDISNIIGAGLDGIIRSAITGDSEGGDALGWGALVPLILAGGAIAFPAAALGLAAIILPAALLAITVTLVVLLGRQALLVILIILAPLAFVAYILPNTEDWFNRWRKLFITMLVFYPMVAILFAGSQVAANIVRSVSSNPLVDIFSLGIIAVPLFATPFLIQFSGSLLGRVAGMVNNPNKGMADRTRNFFNDRAEVARNEAAKNNLENGGKVRGFRQRRKATFERRKSLSAGILDESKQEYLAKRALGHDLDFDESKVNVAGLNAEERANKIKEAKEEAMEDRGKKFAAKLAGGDEKAALSVQASAQSMVDKLENESVTNREIYFRAKFDPRTALTDAQAALTKATAEGDKTSARAAQKILLSGGTRGVELLESGLQKAEEDGHFADKDGEPSAVSRAIREDLAKAGLKGKNNALTTWSFMGGSTIAGRIQASDTYTGLNPVEMAGQTAADFKYAADATGKKDGKGYISPAMASSILENTQATALLDEDKKQILKTIVKDGEWRNPKPDKRFGGGNGGSGGNPEGGGSNPNPNRGGSGGGTPQQPSGGSPNPSSGGGSAPHPGSMPPPPEERSSTTGYAPMPPLSDRNAFLGGRSSEMKIDHDDRTNE